jgi:hypothetical protein
MSLGLLKNSLVPKEDEDTDNKELPADDSKLNEFLLSRKICRVLLGVSPKTFHETNGEGTLLFNEYTDSAVTEDGDLVLHLTDNQVDQWRNSNVFMQILQKIMGKEKQIVTKVIVPTSFPFESLYKNSNKCGYEISDDYTKIVVGPGDDRSYYSIVLHSCVFVQLLEGKPSDEISVEYIEVDSEGKITEQSFYPTYQPMFQDLDECKELMHYEQLPAEIKEYTDPQIDKNFKNFEYERFWGMSYHSENLDYEIYAYEFTNAEAVLKYCRQVSKNNNTHIDESGTLYLTQLGGGEYIIFVVKDNMAYKLVAYNTPNFKINNMLSKVFSIKV